MAQAKVTKEISKIQEVTLTLNIEEVEYLSRLLGNHIIGMGKVRKLSDGIWSALDTCTKERFHDRLVSGEFMLDMSHAKLENTKDVK